MQRIPAEQLNYEFSRHLTPRARVAPGETIIVEAEDALSGQIRTSKDRRDKTTMPFSNPVTGPIFVEGAQPGDAHFQRWCHERARPLLAPRRERNDVVQLVGRVLEKAADVSSGLPNPLFVFDKRNPDVAFAVFSKADAGRDRDIGLLDQQFGKLHASERLERLRYRGPREHRRAR